MFSFLGDLTGDNAKQEDKTTQKAEVAEAGSSLGLGLGSIWSVATAVTSAVKQTADEVVKSVQQTDWKSELATFTHEVEAEAHKAVEAVQHLPKNIQAPHKSDGASGDSPTAASSSGAAVPLVSVGASLAEFGKQLITGTKEVLDTVTEMVEGEIATAAKEVPRFASTTAGSRTAGSGTAAARLAGRRGAAARYSRFEAEVAAMQRDSSTYCDEPEDLQDYNSWRTSTFSMGKMQPEIDKLLTGNAFMAELQSRIVPLLVEQEDFWARYFYRLHKLQQKEEQRQQLAARVKQQDDQEELGGWDDEDPQSPRHKQQQQQEQQQQEHTAGLQEASFQVKVLDEEQQRQQQQQEKVKELQVESAGATESDRAKELNKQQQQQQQQVAVKEQEEQGRGAALAVGSSFQTQRQASATAPAAAAGGGGGAGREMFIAAATSSEASSSSTATTPAAGTAEQQPTESAGLSTASAAAAAVQAAAVPRHMSTDDSTPSTPVQIGSDISDAAPTTETTSDGSGATSQAAAAGVGDSSSCAAHWTLVGSSPAAAAGQQQEQQQGLAVAGAPGSGNSSRDGDVRPTAITVTDEPGVLDGVLEASKPQPPTAAADVAEPVEAPPAAAVVSAKPAAATAAESDDDEDWGDDADEITGRVGVVTLAAAAASGGVGSKAAADADDDWGNWD